jgi:hypothetical protein
LVTVFTRVNCGAMSLLLIVQVAVSPTPNVIELVPTGDPADPPAGVVTQLNVAEGVYPAGPPDSDKA